MLTMTDVVGLRRIEIPHASSSSPASPPPLGRFVSASLPLRMGNALPIAYGGCALSLSVHAAYQTLPAEALSKLRIYTVLGSFLGPTSLDEPLELEVTSLRDTRSFATRAVVASQLIKGKGADESMVRRNCLFLIIDFIATQGMTTILKYSAQPNGQHPEMLARREDLPDYEGDVASAVEAGQISREASDKYMEAFRPARELTDARISRQGIVGQTMNGFSNVRASTQDGRPLTQRTSYDWFKSKRALEICTSSESSSSARLEKLILPPTPAAASACFLAFQMDAMIAFIPLSHSHIFYTSAEACSSLDVALRFHVDDIDAQDWHLRELFTLAGSDERTYSESRLFRETEQGKRRDTDGSDNSADRFQLVATMTQTSVLRGKLPSATQRSRGPKL